MPEKMENTLQWARPWLRRSVSKNLFMLLRFKFSFDDRFCLEKSFLVMTDFENNCSQDSEFSFDDRFAP